MIGPRSPHIDLSGTRFVAIVGPTGTGKTALAAAIADRLPCHLISCDAVQVYRDLSAATAKPRGTAQRHAWALVDWVEPGDDVDAGRWVRAAQAELRWAHTAGRVPLVVGGTGMYLRGLTRGLAQAPPRDAALRDRLVRLADRHGTPRLHRVLHRLDPTTAARLGPNDRQRLVRALEVRLLEGQSLAQRQDGAWASAPPRDVLRIGLQLPRPELYAAVDERVEDFFRAGLIAEVRWLIEVRGVPREANCWRAIGYRETAAWLSDPDRPERSTLIAEVQRSTRRYVKRQETWFRSEGPTVWLDARAPDLVARALAEIERRLAL